jgi:hypothetical protein
VIRARVQLMRMLQGMFETHLRGLYRWGEVAFHVAEAADKPEGKRKQAYGKFKEIVAIRFGDYDLTVESPNERPPLGHIVLTGPSGTIEIDSLDASALDQIGRRIRSQTEEVVSYG